MAEDEMVGWHHQLNGHEFEEILGDSEGQGSLVCCRSWSCKEMNTNNLGTEWLLSWEKAMAPNSSTVA